MLDIAFSPPSAAPSLPLSLMAHATGAELRKSMLHLRCCFEQVDGWDGRSSTEESLAYTQRWVHLATASGRSTRSSLEGMIRSGKKQSPYNPQLRRL